MNPLSLSHEQNQAKYMAGLVDVAFGMLTDEEMVVLIMALSGFLPERAISLVRAHLPPEKSRSALLLRGLVPPGSSFASSAGDIAVMAMSQGVSAPNATIPTNDALRIVRGIVPDGEERR